MSKKVWIIISIIASLAILTVGAGTALADDSKAGNKPPLLPVGPMDKLTQQLRILLASKDEAQFNQELAKFNAAVKQQWKAQQTTDAAFAQVMKELLAIQDEAQFKAAVAKAVADKKITQEQADKITAQWKVQRERAALDQTTRSLLAITDEVKFNAAVADAVAAKKLTQEQVNNIATQWKKMQEPNRFTMSALSSMNTSRYTDGEHIPRASSWMTVVLSGAQYPYTWV